MTENYGELTGSALGMIMRVAVGRAVEIIRSKRFAFEREVKPDHNGQLIDLVTNADKEAQKAVIRVLRESTPTFGIVAEEDHLREEPRSFILNAPPRRWTVDPLDGTKAFGRLQSHGIGSMLALLEYNQVIGVCIADVMTGEMYFFRPGSTKVHRMDHTGAHLRLDLLDPTRSLQEQYLLVRDNPWEFAPAVMRRLIPRANQEVSLFKDFEIEGGSIGLSFARLWKGEVGGILLLGDRPNNPWDWAPVMGISEKLGYVPLRLEAGNDRILTTLPYTIDLNDDRAPGCSILVVHKTHVQTISDWYCSFCPEAA